MPENQIPTEFGAGAEPVPAALWRQLAHSFRSKPGEALASERV
jgi:hypothetical protein